MCGTSLREKISSAELKDRMGGSVLKRNVEVVWSGAWRGKIIEGEEMHVCIWRWRVQGQERGQAKLVQTVRN